MIDELLNQLEGAFAPNTLRSYRADFEHFQDWCHIHVVDPFNADSEDIAAYIESMIHEKKSATIRRRINALRSIFRYMELPNPAAEYDASLALRRMNRKLGRAQIQATPLTRDILDKLMATCDDRPKGRRDRVLLQLGYESMRRRSELCSFAFEDLSTLPTGKPAILVRRSKTDQEGQGKILPISGRLLSLIDAWRALFIEQGLAPTGPILRRVYKDGKIGPKGFEYRTISDLLKELQHAAGLDDIPPLSGHSFRVGAALDLLERGVPFEKIMLRGDWKSETTALSYLRAWVGDDFHVYED